MKEISRLLAVLEKETMFMSNTNLARRLEEYETLVNWDPKESVAAIIEEIRKPFEEGRIGGMIAIQLLRDITGENPDHYAYQDVGSGFVAVTIHDAIEAWIRWYDEIVIGGDEVPL